MEATDMREIPFFNYQKLFGRQEEEFVAIFRDVLKRGAFILQKDMFDFEKNLAKFLNVKHAFGVADGTEALIIAIKAAGLGEGDEVIVPSHTYIASVASIKLTGCTPVLVDCCKDHMIDPVSAEAAVTSKTKAIMPVQLNGRTANMDAIQAIADKHDLIIIEDSAQALGSKFKGRNAGTFGAAGTFSFYPAKVLGCMGDGGAIVTNDDEMARKISLLRDHGRNEDGLVVDWGYNSRLDNLQAAFLDFKLKTFPEEIKLRRHFAALYEEGLGDIPQVQTAPAPDADPDHFDVYQNYEIEAENRDELMEFLRERGVRSVVQWAGKAVHQFEHLGFDVKPPYTEEMFKKCFMLPMNTTMVDEDVTYICALIREFYNK